MVLQLDFSGKVAIVTGGASGIGKTTAQYFAQSHASVVIADVSPQGEEMAARLRESGHDARFCPVDVSSMEDTLRLAEYAEREFRGVDVLVNCAGIFPRGGLLHTDDALWDRIMGVNLKGVFHCCASVVPAMIRRGGGAIVNVGSVNARTGAPNLFAYSTSKGGVVTITRNLAHAHAKDQIRVNCVHPGWVITEGENLVQKAEGKPDNWAELAQERIPLGKMLTPEDVAPTILFLSSDLAKQITGQEIAVDGGTTT